MRVTDQYFWNALFLLFFLCLAFMATVILKSEAVKTFESLVVADYVLMALAAFRLVRLFVYDAMLAFFREQFYDLTEYKGKAVLMKPDSGPRRTIVDLLTCPWCFGVWAAFVVSFFYLLTEYAFYPTLLLALSGVVTLIQLVANVLGYKVDEIRGRVE